jgi:hypothetical protein
LTSLVIVVPNSKRVKDTKRIFLQNLLN